MKTGGTLTSACLDGKIGGISGPRRTTRKAKRQTHGCATHSSMTRLYPPTIAVQKPPVKSRVPRGSLTAALKVPVTNDVHEPS